MALSPYTPTAYTNNQAPARNATNLNKTEGGIKAVTDETITQAQQIADLGNTGISLAYYYMSGGSAGDTISNAWLDIANYDTFGGVVVTGNPVTGELRAFIDGDYHATANISIGFDDTVNNTPVLSVRVVGDIAFVSETITIGISKNATTAAMFPSPIMPLIENENYKLQIMSDIDLINVTYQMAYFSLDAKL